MSVVLAFDTSAPVVGVGLLADGATIVRTERVIRGSERRLMPLASELLSIAGLSPAQLDGIAVAAGPGAFTGLRVGLATACGLAQAIDRPVLPTMSLLPRALRVGTDHPLLVLLDARKSRVYAAGWRDGARCHPPADVPPEEAVRWLGGAFSATGEGAVVYREVVTAAGGIVLPDAELPGVGALAIEGAAALARGEGVDPAEVRPTYLRAPDAVKRVS